MKKYWITLMLAALGSGLVGAAPGDTKVAKWKDDRTAAFLLMYDDGWPSLWQVAIPEMVKRGMIGTFYINPDKGEYKKFEEKWTKEIPQTGMIYGNHTMTHQGVRDMEHAEYEVGACADYIRKVTAKPKPELLSYGQPGVGPGKWNITKEQLDELLKKYHMIDRPPFAGHGAVYHHQTTEQMIALADKAIADKGMEYIVFHGIERKEPNWGYQDFWALKQDIFFPLLDQLKEKSDKGDLWITDHITQHKYVVQRDAAEVNVLRKAPNGIELELKSTADAQWYDGPLTLITEVPSGWKKATVSQGETKATVDVKDGVVKFDALPGVVRIVGQ